MTYRIVTTDGATGRTVRHHAVDADAEHMAVLTAVGRRYRLDGGAAVAVHVDALQRGRGTYLVYLVGGMLAAHGGVWTAEVSA